MFKWIKTSFQKSINRGNVFSSFSISGRHGQRKETSEDIQSRFQQFFGTPLIKYPINKRVLWLSCFQQLVTDMCVCLSRAFQSCHGYSRYRMDLEPWLHPCSASLLSLTHTLMNGWGFRRPDGIMSRSPLTPASEIILLLELPLLCLVSPASVIRLTQHEFSRKLCIQQVERPVINVCFNQTSAPESQSRRLEIRKMLKMGLIHWLHRTDCFSWSHKDKILVLPLLLPWFHRF